MPKKPSDQDVLAFYEHQDKQWYWHIMMGF